ncbi:MAG TPA: hypothetical protein VFK38_04155 [Candidatus Limnocylindrales bacterium]|nr:hypothetical protein [Candidatus Limnocylindrales bacterium]
MVEYGNAGRVANEATGGGGSGRVGAGGSPMDLISDAVDRVASLPPEQLILFAVVALVGLFIFRRAV